MYEYEFMSHGFFWDLRVAIEHFPLANNNGSESFGGKGSMGITFIFNA